MGLFLSTFENKIDKKGRVSVPANFRNVVTGKSFNGVIAYSSFVNECIEACAIDRIEKLHESIDRLDPFSTEHDAFATTILGGSVQLQFDSEGRILLPENLIETAKLQDKATFVGKGATFEIWQPKLFNDYNAKAREIAKKERGVLSFNTKDKDS
jgi:MraZ protein